MEVLGANGTAVDKDQQSLFSGGEDAGHQEAYSATENTPAWGRSPAFYSVKKNPRVSMTSKAWKPSQGPDGRS